MACGTNFSSVFFLSGLCIGGMCLGGEKNILLIRVPHIFDFMAFGEFRGLSLCWSLDGCGYCAYNDRNPIPIFSIRLLMIISSGWIFSLGSTTVLWYVSVFGSSMRMRMLSKVRDASYLSVIQLKSLMMAFKGFWETYRDSCASRVISESWDWSEDLVEVVLLYRYNSLLWVG